MSEFVSTGVWAFPELPAPDLVGAISHAEVLGLDEFWLGDEGPAREPFSVLAGAATVTDRIKLAVGITNPYVRTSALAVTSALTIHELSDGRAILGVGAGGHMSLQPFGITAERPLQAVEQFLENAIAVRAGEAHGTYDPPDIAMSGSVSAQQMPIFVGGRGPRINTLASRLADGAFVAGLPPFRYRDVIGYARSRRPISIALYPSVAFDDEAIDHHRPEMIWSLLDAPESVCEDLGIDHALLAPAADALRRGDRGPASALITDELLPDLMLFGRPSAVGAALADLVRQHQPDSIGLALMQPGLAAGIEDASSAFAAMHENLRVDPTPGNIS